MSEEDQRFLHLVHSHPLWSWRQNKRQCKEKMVLLLYIVLWKKWLSVKWSLKIIARRKHYICLKVPLIYKHLASRTALCPNPAHYQHSSNYSDGLKIVLLFIYVILPTKWRAWNYSVVCAIQVLIIIIKIERQSKHHKSEVDWWTTDIADNGSKCKTQ